jgi:hypothetical protein
MQSNEDDATTKNIEKHTKNNLLWILSHITFLAHRLTIFFRFIYQGKNFKL